MQAFASFRGISYRGIYGVGWRRFFKDLYKETMEDNVFNGGAALGYYFTLAIFPAMISLLSLLPYIPAPDLQTKVFDVVSDFLPKDAANLLIDTIQKIVSMRTQGLLSAGALLTLWAASAGVYAIMQQINITYDVKESRSYLKARGLAIALTIGFGFLIMLSFVTIVAGDAVETWMEINLAWSEPILFLFAFFRWVVIPVFVALAMALVYYFGPDVQQEFKFITPGSLMATVLLILVSLGFKTYVENFGNYNATYGGIGAVIILMLWLNFLGVLILLGSEVNALFEHYSPEGKLKGQKAAEAPIEKGRRPLPRRTRQTPNSQTWR